MKHNGYILILTLLLSASAGAQSASTNNDKSNTAEAKTAVSSKCDEDPRLSRSKEEREACKQREAKRKATGAGVSGGKDQSFDSTTSGRPDPERAPQRQ